MIRVRDKEVNCGWDFPCYGISDDRNMIVYFTTTDTGVCIYASEGELEDAGYSCQTWNMRQFSPVAKGKIIEIET